MTRDKNLKQTRTRTGRLERAVGRSDGALCFVEVSQAQIVSTTQFRVNSYDIDKHPADEANIAIYHLASYICVSK